MNKKQTILFLFLIILSSSIVSAREWVNDIFIVQEEVFDKTDKDWFFAAKLANALRFMTKEYIISDEILFFENEEINDELIDETERNLRRTQLFSDVSIELIQAEGNTYDIYVKAKDRWSTRPSALFGTGGNAKVWGGRLEELNLFGTGTKLSIEALHRSENNIGWQAAGIFKKNRIFRTEYGVEFNILSNKYRTDQYFKFDKPFRTLDTKHNWGLTITNIFGSDFLFSKGNDFGLMPVHERKLQTWFSRAWRSEDRVFFTTLLELEDINRGLDEFKRAFDNSGRFLVAFSSNSEQFIRERGLNTYNVEDISIGGWGTAILGKIFPIGSKGEGLYYAAGQGERSFLSKDRSRYLFVQMTGAAGFSQSIGRYTYQEFLGIAFYRPIPQIVFGGRVRQQTVWNWKDALRQLVLDNDAGLRGYEVNQFVGDNRIIANIECRLFPDYRFWIFKLGAALFWDSGTVWRQDTHLSKTQWHNSVGFGFRFFDSKASGQSGTLRIDFAFNLDEKRFSQIIFSTDQLFSIFQNHDFRIPQLFGTEFDYE